MQMNEIEVDPDTTLSQFVENYIQKPKENPEEDQLRGDYSALKLIPNFLSSEECDFFSGLVSSNSKHRIQQLSNRKRLIFDSEITASWFWERMKPFNPFQHVLDEHGDQWIATGINPRFRLIRYDTGDQFRTHEDGFYLGKLEQKNVRYCYGLFKYNVEKGWRVNTLSSYSYCGRTSKRFISIIFGKQSRSLRRAMWN